MDRRFSKLGTCIAIVAEPFRVRKGGGIMLKSFVTLTLASILVLVGNSYAEWIGGTRGWNYSNADTNFYPWSTACRVGIGTSSPNQKLEISGVSTYRGLYMHAATGRPTITLGNDDGASNLKLSYIQAQNGNLIFGRLNDDWGGHNEAVRIDNTGNVGIGTTSPGAKLEVNGDVTASGYVLAPNQPAFLARSPTSNSVPQDPIVFGTEAFDVGDNYDATTGKFTAPVGGTYLISYRLVFGNATVNGQYMTSNIKLNGNWAYGVERQLSFFTNNSSNNTYLSMSDSIVLQLSAGDYVTVICDDHPASWDGTLWTHGCYFSGSLLH